GSSLEFGGHSIGTIAFGSGSATVSALTAFATPAVVDALAEAFGYRSTSENPTATSATRTVDFTFNDGGNTGSGGALDNVTTVSQTINITAVDDAPVNHVPAATQITATNTDIT